MRFINIDSEYYNADYIQSYYFTTGQKMRVFFKDGEPKTVDAKNRRYWEAEMSGAAYVVQVIPCETPVWAVWVNDDDTHYAEKIYFLGLCADGGIYPLHLCDGYFAVEDSSNFVGLYYETSLSQFDNLERSDADEKRKANA